MAEMKSGVKPDEERRRTLTKKSNLMDVAASFTSYTWVALDEPIDGDFRNVRPHLSFHADIHGYAITKLRSGFSLSDVVRHLRLACEFITPRYGFSHSVPGASGTNTYEDKLGWAK